MKEKKIFFKLKEYPKILTKTPPIKQPYFQDKEYNKDVLKFCIAEGQNDSQAKFTIRAYAAYKNMDAEQSIEKLCSQIQINFNSFKQWFSNTHN